jgi:serine/threonine protein kinase
MSTSNLQPLPSFPLNAYTPIAEAGDGLYGVVYFSMRNSDFVLAQQKKSTNTYEELKSKLFAVKVLKHTTTSVYSEVMANLELRQAVTNFGHFAHHRDAFALVENAHVSWLATRAVVPGMVLDELVDKIGGLPLAVLLQYFIDAVEIVRFINKVVNPPILHGDIHGRNILLDPTKPNTLGMPSLVLIDFSTPRADVAQSGVSHPRLDLQSVFNRFTADMDCCADLKQFRTTEFPELFEFDLSHDKLKRRIQKRLDDVLAETDPSSIETFRQRVEAATAANDNALMLAFRETGLLE